ncbi:MAG: transporter protein [Ignavibacteria bacterium]|nr:transporter protein [Ignavibacteria bacterium]
MQPILKAHSIFKKFNDLIAVNNLSFEVYKGEIFGFLGPNGAGKTTSIKIMCGLLKPDGGKIEILGNHKGNSIGICPQHIVIWDNLTCLEQLTFMGKMHSMNSADARKRGIELLESFGLIEKKAQLARTLSGGMQRRLNIALALIHSPEILFLDEPQAGLDPQSRVLVRDYIRNIKSKITVVLTTHDMEEAEKLSDRICIIDRGQILKSGTTEEIKKSCGEEDLLELDIQGNIRTELIQYLAQDASNHTIISENSASFKITDSFSILESILHEIKTRNIKVDNLKLRKKSLEDIFINLTGRSLRE